MGQVSLTLSAAADDWVKKPETTRSITADQVPDELYYDEVSSETECDLGSSFIRTPYETHRVKTYSDASESVLS